MKLIEQIGMIITVFGALAFFLKMISTILHGKIDDSARPILVYQLFLTIFFIIVSACIFFNDKEKIVTQKTTDMEPSCRNPEKLPEEQKQKGRDISERHSAKKLFSKWNRTLCTREKIALATHLIKKCSSKYCSNQDTTAKGNLTREDYFFTIGSFESEILFYDNNEADVSNEDEVRLERFLGRFNKKKDYVLIVGRASADGFKGNYNLSRRRSEEVAAFIRNIYPHDLVRYTWFGDNTMQIQRNEMRRFNLNKDLRELDDIAQWNRSVFIFKIDCMLLDQDEASDKIDSKIESLENKLK